MESQQSGAPPLSPPSNTGVRRHHTISASSRRASTRPAISEEVRDQESWNDDEVVDQDWVGGVGVVGEKSSLHRQSSLPTRHHRGKLFTLPLLIESLNRCSILTYLFFSPQHFKANNPRGSLEI